MPQLYRYGNKLLVRDNKIATSVDCCCKDKRLCVVAGANSPLYPANLVVNESSDLSVCAAVSAFDYSTCIVGVRRSFILSDNKIAAYVAAGGVYFVNTEWDNFFSLQKPPNNQCHYNFAGQGCDSGTWFNSHLSAIGCSISRDIPTISIQLEYSNTGTPLFDGQSFAGGATAGLSGGIAIATAAGQPYCFGPGGEVLLSGGVPVAGQNVGNGVVIAIADSNFEVSNPALLGQRLLTLRPADML